MPSFDIGKLLLITGITLAILGLVFIFISKLPSIPKLPGDIYIQKKNFSFYFPLATCVLISIIISVILWFITRK